MRERERERERERVRDTETERQTETETERQQEGETERQIAQNLRNQRLMRSVPSPAYSAGSAVKLTIPSSPEGQQSGFDYHRPEGEMRRTLQSGFEETMVIFGKIIMWYGQ